MTKRRVGLAIAGWQARRYAMNVSATICVPEARAGGLLWLLRALWTAPTTLLGRSLARMVGCGPGERIGGRAVPAYLYRLPPGRLRGLGAIALGHAIVVEPEFIHGRETWVLAHELSHARQHDVLGPFYLALHGLLQLISSLVCLWRPVAGYPPQHAYNPLERAFLCVPFDVLVKSVPPSGPRARALLDAFGLAPR
jgi:hypothetical protein